MRTNRIRRSRKKLVIAISALVIAATPFVSSGSRAWGDPPTGPGGGNEKTRKLNEKEFLQEHSDASGKPRPDLWRKGVEQQSRCRWLRISVGIRHPRNRMARRQLAQSSGG